MLRSLAANRTFLQSPALRNQSRRFASDASKGQLDAFIVGVHKPKSGPIDTASFSYSAAQRNEQFMGKLSSQLNLARFEAKLGQSRVLYGLNEVEGFVGVPPIVIAVGLGSKSDDAVKAQGAARTGAAASIGVLKGLLKHSDTISVGLDTLGSAKGAAEGAFLAKYKFDQHKLPKSRQPEVNPLLLSTLSAHSDEWSSGVILAEAQNLARTLMEQPANFMTPTIFANTASEFLSSLDNTKVTVYDREWAESQGMGAFLCVGKGSSEPVKFLEIVYRGRGDRVAPLALVGKGVTFDSGGISIKPSNDMAMMKGDMGGAAVVLSSLWAIARKKLPINVVGVIPLVENMPSGIAVKPGDLVRASNGKTIEVDNTDAEGRLILADAIHYAAKTHNPQSLVTLSTLTGAMDVALGYNYAGVFTNAHKLWSSLEAAGKVAGDPFWRMPLDKAYLKQMESNVADLKNVGGRGGGSCTAAIFLKQFMPEAEQPESEESEDTSKETPFAHIDIAGVMHKKGGSDILANGMTGRPTRSIIEYCESISLE